MHIPIGRFNVLQMMRLKETPWNTITIWRGLNLSTLLHMRLFSLILRSSSSKSNNMINMLLCSHDLDMEKIFTMDLRLEGSSDYEGIIFFFFITLSYFFLSFLFYFIFFIYFKCLELFIVCCLSLFNFYFFSQVCNIMMNELLFSTRFIFINYMTFPLPKFKILLVLESGSYSHDKRLSYLKSSRSTITIGICCK